MYSFEKLNVYQSAKELVRRIYIIQNTFPREEKYALGDQVRRAALSITSNIAEGSGRESYKEKVHFIEIAYGSLTEVFSQLQVAQNLGFISEEDFESLRPYFEEVSKMLSGLRRSFKDQLSQNSLTSTPQPLTPNP